MKNKKAPIKRTIYALIIVGFTILFLTAAQRQNQDTICFENTCIEIELATTPKEITTGLMHRTELCESCGMLFIFKNDDTHRFWMKNTLIPLDIIWMDANSKIIYIQKEAKPCNTPACPTYGPETNSRYVLEVNRRYAEKHNINIGDTAEIFILE
ncbi:MAG: hypothetical protein DRN71_00005 [Candidatus Nanohalarchaeota archaeon]|nr:MAG: hypothetical protein DRN71_00005 [Candidatus Nanohaloarchaeota archaeon]